MARPHLTPSRRNGQPKSRFTHNSYPYLWADWIYFIDCPVARVIKIGVTQLHPDARFNTIASSSPVPVYKIGVMLGSPLWESRLHERFRDLRVRGEWFRYDLRLSRFIYRWADQWPKPDVGFPPRSRVLINRPKGNRISDEVRRSR